MVEFQRVGRSSEAEVHQDGGRRPYWQHRSTDDRQALKSPSAKVRVFAPDAAFRHYDVMVASRRLADLFADGSLALVELRSDLVPWFISPHTYPELMRLCVATGQTANGTC